MEWIIKNKEWFFSGAGIFAISSIISIISIIITIIIKSKSEKRKIKNLNIDFELKKISLPETDEKNDFTHNLNISYKNKEYKNLCYLTIDIRNTGLIAIENQSILIKFPKETIFIEKYEKFCNSTIKVIRVNEENHENDIEIIKEINRLEANDYLKFIYLVDAGDSEKIKVTPRGVDNIEYSINNSLKSDRGSYEKLSLIIGLYIIFDSIPFIGGYLKALVIVFGFSIIKSNIIGLFEHKKDNAQNITFKDNKEVTVDIINNNI